MSDDFPTEEDLDRILEERTTELEDLARKVRERILRECPCGGPRGHVPGGIHCRRP